MPKKARLYPRPVSAPNYKQNPRRLVLPDNPLATHPQVRWQPDPDLIVEPSNNAEINKKCKAIIVLSPREFRRPRLPSLMPQQPTRTKKSKGPSLYNPYKF